MEEVRASFVMEIDLDPPPPAPEWPEGIRVRLRRDGDEGEFFRVERETFRDHRGHVDGPVEEDFDRFRHVYETDEHYDPTLWFLARAGEETAGFLIATPATAGEPDTGWVWSLGVRRPFRRRGIGLALLCHAFDELRRRGIARAGLSVDAQSLTGATRLYEKAGMKVVEDHVIYEKELRPGVELRTWSSDGD
jgi:ribosomal protein S18 acetylase RimI-like enzyme